jgi:carbonic anhydrase
VRACLEHDAARQTEAQFIRNWMSMLDDARAHIVKELAGQPVGDQLAALEREGLKTSLANLRTFPCIQSLEGRGKLALHGAHFDIGTGTLSVLNQGTGEFVSI